MPSPNAPQASTRKIRRTVYLTTVLLPLALFVWTPIPGRADITVITVPYKSIANVPPFPLNILTDIYEPVGAGPFPAVVMVHGGDWKDGWRGDQAPQATQMAQMGIVVFSVDFRMPCNPSNIKPGVDPNLCSSSGYNYAYPIPTTDIQSAVSWVRSNGYNYKAIKGRTGILGGSSGGNLAMEVGVVGSGATLPDAIVSWSGRGDLTTDPTVGGSARTNYIGCSYKNCATKWKNASPSLSVGPGDPLDPQIMDQTVAWLYQWEA